MLLDLDDTILAFDSVVDESWMAVLQQHAEEFSPVDIETVFHAIKSCAKEFWRDPDRHRIGRLDLTSARHTIIADALTSMARSDDELVRRMATEYEITRTQAIHPIPGAIETIQLLRQKGIRLALITNGEAKSQREKIERFHLEPFFDAVLIEGECGYGKPDKRVYIQALESLGVHPPVTWMVGDNWEWEVVAPLRIGIRGIWVNVTDCKIPGDGTIRPFLVIKSLPELMVAT